MANHGVNSLNKKPHIVIVGAGFAGMAAAKHLAKGSNVTISLIDQRNHHLFQPLLYQVATAGLNPADIAVPIRSQFAGAENVAVYLGQVERVDLIKNRIVATSGISLDYDYLILACGAQHSYFGKSEWESLAPGLKTLEQATEIRRRILSAFEFAETEVDRIRQGALLTFVVVGGGPTGVELAGAIADIARTVLVRDFRRINPASARVVLVEAGPRILASFPERLSVRATRDLAKLGVEVCTSARVEHIDEDGVVMAGDRIGAKNVFWAAGVQASHIGGTLGVSLDRAGRVPVAADLSVPDHRNVFVVGDMAHFELPNGSLLPGVAPAAIQSGRWAARNVMALIKGQQTLAFKYFDKGQMATIGKHRAIAQTARLTLTGYLAWLAWLFIHVLYLVTFRNRVAVLVEWTWSYLFSKRGARLITNRDWKLYEPSVRQSIPDTTNAPIKG